ncbi:MAG: hypothetical protein HC841_05575 [Verrucomicrobiae bacterium]|nr:hypothetical protein [Verrucomicrobiae bacterium]
MISSRLTRTFPLALCLAAAIPAPDANASLIGVDIGFPRISFKSPLPMSFSYDSVADDLVVEALPTAAIFSLGELPGLFTGMVGLTIEAKVDSTGTLIGGGSGHDFKLVGSVSRMGTVYEGPLPLLTGEITAFGFQESGNTDQFDFQFTGTGGSLLADFQLTAFAADITTTATMLAPGFNGDFTTSFSGSANGIVGATRNAVPDAGGTLSLLAAAMIGVVAVRRRAVSSAGVSDV